MTREEAKEILTHNWTRVDNPNYSESELDEAFFMAIEALSQPIVCKDYCIDDDHIYCSPKVADRVVEALTSQNLTEPNNTCEADLISRADAIEMLCKSCRHDDKEHYYPNCKLQMCCDDINAINALPSADVDGEDLIIKGAKGHWIDDETNYTCSECYRGCWVNSDYCPWCGADMRGEEA